MRITADNNYDAPNTVAPLWRGLMKMLEAGFTRDQANRLLFAKWCYRKGRLTDDLPSTRTHLRV